MNLDKNSMKVLESALEASKTHYRGKYYESVCEDFKEETLKIIKEITALENKILEKNEI